MMVESGDVGLQMTILCRLMSSMAATAAVAALRFGRAFRLPSMFTQLAPAFPAAAALEPMYSSSASAPSLSSSLIINWGRDFFFLIVVPPANDDDEVDELMDVPADVVEPVVRVGGPGEYIAAAEPGRDAGSGNISGSI